MKSRAIALVRWLGRFWQAVAKVVYTLSEEYQFFRRLALVTGLGIAVYATARIFGHNPPAITPGAAAAYGCVAALVAAVAAIYLMRRSKEGGDEG